MFTLSLGASLKLVAVACFSLELEHICSPIAAIVGPQCCDILPPTGYCLSLADLNQHRDDVMVTKRVTTAISLIGQSCRAHYLMMRILEIISGNRSPSVIKKKKPGRWRAPWPPPVIKQIWTPEGPIGLLQ